MKCEWKEVELSEVADLTVGFVGTMASHYTDNGVLFLRSTNIEPFHIKMDDVKYISPEFNETIIKSQLNTDDVVIVRTGKPGACTVIPQKTAPWNCSDLVIIHPNKEKINPHFLASYINLASGVINAHLVGAVQQHFNVGAAKKMKIPLPSIDIQNRIASMIQGLNNKIELNNKINGNLLEQADLLYERIFSNERNLTELGNVIKTTSGGTPSRKHTELYENPSICWVKSKELNGSFIHTTEEMINKITLSKSAAKMLPAHSVLVAMYGATVGEYGIIASPMTCNQAVCALLPNDRYPYPYLYELIRHSKDILKKMAVGSAQQNISQVLIKQLLVHINLDKVEQFTDATRASFQMIETLTLENIRLAFIRDTMLPKLMSGEINIEDVNI